MRLPEGRRPPDGGGPASVRSGWGLFVLAALVLLVLPVAAAGQRSLVVEAFDATISVQQDGTIDVQEQIRVRFNGSWNGIFRTIPVEYRTPQGFSYRLWLDDVEVRGQDGSPLEYDNQRERHYRRLRIRVPGASDATRTVVIRYSVPNGLKFWDEYEELYWNVTGDEWEIPIQNARAMVLLPPDVRGRRTASWTGGYGSTENAASVTETEEGFYFEATRPLNYREGLTIAVAWDPGVVERPSAVTRAVDASSPKSTLVSSYRVSGVWRTLRSRSGRPASEAPTTAMWSNISGHSSDRGRSTADAWSRDGRAG